MQMMHCSNALLTIHLYFHFISVCFTYHCYSIYKPEKAKRLLIPKLYQTQILNSVPYLLKQTPTSLTHIIIYASCYLKQESLFPLLLL